MIFRTIAATVCSLTLTAAAFLTPSLAESDTPTPTPQPTVDLHPFKPSTPESSPLGWMVPDNLLDADGIVWEVKPAVRSIEPGAPADDLIADATVTEYLDEPTAYVFAGVAQPEPGKQADIAALVTTKNIAQFIAENGHGAKVHGLRDEPNIKPLAGCQTTRRWVGTLVTPPKSYPMGFTFCETSRLDVVALTLGVVDGHEGFTATDHVVALMLDRVNAATPSAG